MTIGGLFLLSLYFCGSIAYASYNVEVVPSTGAITGTVFFPGETPPRAMFGNNAPGCPHGIGQNHLLVKQINLALENALVILEIDHGLEAKVARGQLVTQGCVFTPRVQWLPASTNLQLKNGDPAAHDIHALQQDVTAFDVPLSTTGSVGRRPLIHLGLYKVNCDRHLWERAWIYVSPHPYVAITNADGLFVIKNVPPGHYQLRVWHEGWIETDKDPAGRMEYIPMGQTREVSVSAEKTTSVIFDRLERLP
jgi:hypothetical protein